MNFQCKKKSNNCKKEEKEKAMIKTKRENRNRIKFRQKLNELLKKNLTNLKIT